MMTLTLLSGRCRAAATRGASQYAASGVMSGSMPLALLVTRSIGGGPEAFGFCLRSCAIAAAVDAISFFDDGPKFVPPVEVGSYPLPAADGRPWKYCGLVHNCPMIDEPTTRPFKVTSDPCACLLNSVWATPVIASGYSNPNSTTVRSVNRIDATKYRIMRSSRFS